MPDPVENATVSVDPGSVEATAVLVQEVRAQAERTLTERLEPLLNQPLTPATLYATNQIWSNWNTATCYTNVNNVVWKTWNTASITSTAGSIHLVSDTVWRNWVSNSSTNNNYILNGGYRETPEQRAAREASEVRYRAEETARRTLRAEADKRAETLLRSHLTPEQQAQLKSKDWFLIVSKSGKVYRINRGRNANIDVLDETGKTVRSLCVHPREHVPDADTMLSQVMMLKHDEDALLTMAIKHGSQHGWRRGGVPDPVDFAAFGLETPKVGIVERIQRLVA